MASSEETNYNASKNVVIPSTKPASDIWENCAKIHPQIIVPGYWESLERNCAQWADDVTVSPFWKAVKDQQPSWSNKFNLQTNGALLASPGLPNFVGKSRGRVREKIEQKLTGKSPVPASAIWDKKVPVPILNDLVRVRVECQFVDGVEYFAQELESLAKSAGIKYSRTREGRVEGYFAQHFCFEQDVFFRFGGGSSATKVVCEIQVATALASRIWESSHKVYERWRGKQDDIDDWQWNPQDPRFVARQLGHMIHLADGLLAQLRDIKKMKNEC